MGQKPTVLNARDVPEELALGLISRNLDHRGTRASFARFTIFSGSVIYES